MSSILLMLLGILIVWAAVTNQTADLWTTLYTGTNAKGYVSISLGRFLIGAAVVSVPLFVIEEDSWQKSYILLILLGFLTFNLSGVTRFSSYLQSAVKQ